MARKTGAFALFNYHYCQRNTTKTVTFMWSPAAQPAGLPPPLIIKIKSNNNKPLNGGLRMRFDLNHPLNLFVVTIPAHGALYGLKSIIIDNEPWLMCFQDLHKLRLFLLVARMVCHGTCITALVISAGVEHCQSLLGKKGIMKSYA